MADNQLSFKISTGLKNIIGRDLITDDYVAVFELVKNSFDAYANKVVITFEKDKITIADDGKGMDLHDINNKWLFVAYSAKKEGIEDDELEEKEFKSYRDKIQAKKFFAGAKGIGRFSCDRLGSKLRLTTKKALSNSSIEQIEVDWNDFDKDPEEKFIDIKVKHRTLHSLPKQFIQNVHGTTLEIYGLNSTWDRAKKLDLRYSLEKLINPFEDNPLNGFSIRIEDESEKDIDNQEKNRRNKINGVVKNFVFETLGLKTTQIVTEIDPDGEFLTNSLFDRDVLIYKIRRKNPTSPILKNIKISLFYLNRSAKNSFTRLMGIQPVNFGSIFLYKNGFRIAPYGDYGVDYFGIDSRHTQALFRTLGLRDLIGRIEIIGTEKGTFTEISNRNGGLVKNDHYIALERLFIRFSLSKLENYVTGVQWTSKEDKDQEDLSALNNIQAKSALLKLVSGEIADGQTELIDADTENLNIRTQELLSEASLVDIEALKIIADKLGNKIFLKDADKAEKAHQKIIELQQKLAKEEEARKGVEEERNRIEQELALEKEKNTYLRTSSRSLSDDAKGLVHNIKIITKTINSNVDTLYDKILNGKVKQDEILKRLGVIKFNSEKALKISMLITRSNFKTQQNEQIVDIAKYVTQYIEVYSEIYEKTDLEFIVDNEEASLIKKASLLDISVILDDLISNSEKAGAKRIVFEISNPKKDSLKIIVSDDGKGVQKQFLEDPQQIFELGVTTTDGSGIGLNSVRTALKAMKGTINFVGNGVKLRGACFEILFN
ncbi:MAG: sensor histidine kinase [Bacteroidetes bacterium]|nr:sensor histidine kinase [Bacteroidota bacterium]